MLLTKTTNHIIDKKNDYAINWTNKCMNIITTLKKLKP